MDILDVLHGQLGYSERPGGRTKYGQWLDEQAGTSVYASADWCGSSLMWCIAQGGPAWSAAAGGVRREFAYVQSWLDWMRAHDRVSRTPKPRRLVWYDWAGTPDGANHIGMVESVSGSTMRVYEGNHNNRFELVTRRIDGQVMGFGEWWSFVPAPADVVDDSCWIG